MTRELLPLKERWQYGRLVPCPEYEPAAWRLVRLVDFARLESGHTPSRRCPEYWDCGVPWVSLHDSKNLDGATIEHTVQSISELGLANSSARLLPAGTVIFSRTATVGKATILGRSMATSQDFANYVCGPAIHNRFLMQLFRFMQPEWSRLMAGSTHNTVYMPVFENLQILLPPLGEQRKIADILSTIDDAIQTTQAVIDQLGVVKKALMAELLTRGIPGRHTKFKQTEIGLLPQGWNAVPIGQLLTSIDAGWSPRCETRSAATHEWGVLKVSAVSWGTFRPDENKKLPDDLQPRFEAEVRAGDLLVSRANTPELVGRCVVVDSERPKLMLSDKILRLCVNQDNATAEYLALVLDTPSARQQIQDGATGSSRSMKNISQEKLRSVSIPAPPLGEQREIVNLFNSLRKRAAVETSALDCFRFLKSALMSALLSGDLRVPPAEDPT